MRLSPTITIQSFPALTRDMALFLDLDGTLANITATPDETMIDPKTLKTLSQINLALGGALAIVSGRSIPDIDRLCRPQQFPAAGQHGLEIRYPNGVSERIMGDKPFFDLIQQELSALQKDFPQLLLEYKGLSLAVHYRQAPEAERAVEDKLSQLVTLYPALQFQKGKRVGEIRFKGAHKGTAIQNFLNQPTFKGRKALFVGDDVTDEDGFRTVNAIHGISIKIGSGQTAAQYQMTDIQKFKNWLTENAAALEAQR